MKFAGPGRVSVDTRHVRGYKPVRATELLDLLATVEPEETTAARQLRRHRIAAESSRWASSQSS